MGDALRKKGAPVGPMIATLGAVSIDADWSYFYENWYGVGGKVLRLCVTAATEVMKVSRDSERSFMVSAMANEVATAQRRRFSWTVVESRSGSARTIELGAHPRLFSPRRGDGHANERSI